MVVQTENSDFILAQRICDKLRSGNREAILELYHKHHVYFSAFTRQRLFNTDQDQIEDVLSDYWIELLNSKAICAYKGKASLRTYLTVILGRRIIDANRKIERERNSKANCNDQENKTFEDSNIQQSPEDEFLIKEQQKLIHEALLQLAEVSPRDAKLIKMHFEDLSYEEMAKREFQGIKINTRKLKKKTDAIKKQFTRDKTGSLAKFKSILKRCLENNSLKYRDLLN